MLEYKDHPGSIHEIHRGFEIMAAGGDYFIRLVDFNRKTVVLFRFCVSGGFEHSHPETTAAVAALHKAFLKESKGENNETK